MKLLTIALYLSWSLELCWLLPGGDFGFSVVEVRSTIRSLVLCPWGLVLLQIKERVKLVSVQLFV